MGTWRLGSASSKSGKTSRDLVSRLSSVAPRVDGLLVELQETETRRLERGTVIPEPGTESRSQETRGQDHATDGRGQKTGNPDTGPGQGTNLGTEGTDQGPERRRRRRKGTDRDPETGIIKNIRKTGASQNRGPGQ